MLLWSLSDDEVSVAAMEGVPPHHLMTLDWSKQIRTMKSPSLMIMALFMN
jgi:hypothetical protein